MTLQREITQHIVSEYLPDTPAEELAADYDLIATGVVTSLQLLRLIGWLGDRYDIPFGDLDIAPDDFRSVAAIAELVSRHRPVAAN
ncbi:phosphopantetheine-binding protein [Streptacidiphilus jiangxiensis]|uniref:Phosphopantetheine attachment site n=1 Tax=Streptacidiphilus jiangxiensis TaxID=235985 RepID=A0A1H7VL95_STRJI|nr:phosphopantetheine-binding protein [Streptacidiphilus jiangxiensis]SEM10016.1 Phosphopantetheine attachment site [Streptacidiphilus jiangxiensis]